MIRRLEPTQADQVVALVARVVAGMRRGAIDQWDEVYPDRSRLAADIASGQAFGAFSGERLVGYVVLNQDQSEEYTSVPWALSDLALVIHRLCVDPESSGQGVGRALLAFAEGWASAHGYPALRLDAFTGNPRALALYERNGYHFRGLVRFRKGVFRCYEKAVDPLATAILAAHGWVGHRVETFTGSFGKRLFAVDQKYLIRTSGAPMDAEKAKIERVAGLKAVPRVLASGLLGDLHYLVLDHLPGGELPSVACRLGEADQASLADEVSSFLTGLHRHRGDAYDIGLYLPTIPDFTGTWRQGHQQYAEGLLAQLASVPLEPPARQAVEAAAAYLVDHAGCLDHQSGPCLLHNDFHLKNLLVSQGRLSGVIDWECSQFGEPDFELVHLVHWALFPPHGPAGADVFTAAVLRAQQTLLAVPRLAERLTFYQIEQDFCQLIWNGGRDQELRALRLDAWVSGAVGRLI